MSTQEELLANLQDLVTKICQKSIAWQEVERFAHICLRFSIAYLRVLESRGRRIRETNDEKELQGLAADCIADLFKRNDAGGFPYLERYFKTTLSSTSKEDLVIALRRLVTHKVQQQLTRIYRQRDPEAAKLYRNIRLASTRHEQLNLTRDVTGEYVSYTPSPPRPENRVVHRPDAYEVEAAAAGVPLASNTIDQVVLQLLRELSGEEGRVVEIAVADLVTTIRRFRKSGSSADFAYDERPLLLNLDIQEKIHSVLADLKSKIVTKYVGKGKIPPEQGLAMFSALKDMAADALAGARLEENYNYLRKFWPALSRQEYMNSTRKVFEYFVRQFKDAVRKEFVDNSD